MEPRFANLERKTNPEQTPVHGVTYEMDKESLDILDSYENPVYTRLEAKFISSEDPNFTVQVTVTVFFCFRTFFLVAICPKTVFQSPDLRQFSLLSEPS